MLGEVFVNLTEFLVETIGVIDYIGIFVLMAIESSFIPFPSEVVLIPAGILVARGEMSFILVLASSILGALTGALINYAIAYHFGRSAVTFFAEKYGKFLLIKKESIDKSEKFLETHGEIMTFLGRLIPGIRQLISLPAGFGNMDLTKFVTYTALGVALWSFILIFIGMTFGENMDLVKLILNTITTWIIIGSILTIIIYILIHKYFKKKKSLNR